MKLKICTALLAAAAVLAPLSLSAEKAQAPAETKQAAAEVYGRLPLSFEATKDSARFLAHSGGYSVLVGAADSSIAVHGKSGKAATLRFAFDHANASAPIEVINPLPGVTNYYLGEDPSQWRLGVKNYAKVRAKAVYPGVDVIYYGDHRRLEFDFVVAPKADASSIALSFSGMEKLYKDASGDLVAEVNGQSIRFAKPLAYQVIEGISKPISADFEMASAGSVHLYVGQYDHNSELIIDPVVSYANYLGGSQGDVANGVAVDSSGNAYVAGATCSSDFPDSSSSIPTNCSAYDAFVTKYSTDGTTYAYTTIIGDTNSKYSVSANAIALDSSNQAYIAGGTNYPGLSHIGLGYLSNPSLSYLNALNTWRGGDSDAFITILASDGSILRTSYLGGSGADVAYGIAVDSSQNVSVVGQTCSYDFPGYNAFETMIEPCVAFITKLDNNLDIADVSALTAAEGIGASPLTQVSTATSGTVTYFFSEFFAGQPSAPSPTAVWEVDTPFVQGAIISDGVNIEVALNTGTSSPNPPSSTTWAWSTKKYGTTLDNGILWENLGPLTTVIYASTEAYGVALDPLGDVFIAGGTNTATGNLVPYSYYVGTGAWVLKVAGTTSPAPSYTPAGSFVYGTVLETTATDKTALTDAAHAIAVDIQGRAYVTGTATGTIFTTPGAYSPSHVGGNDAFLVRMNTAGSAIEYATYLGGTGNDYAFGVAVDGSGAAYVAGSTQSADFPTINAVTNPVTQTKLTTLSGTKDAFISRVSSDGSALTFSTYLSGSDGTDIDQSNAIALDPTNNGNMFVAGNTSSADFTQLNPLGYTGAQSVYMGNGDAFVAKLTATTPVVGLSASSLSFSNQVLNSASGALTVTVTNKGSVPLNFTGITITGVESGDFSQTNSCGQVAANSTCTISAIFTPTQLGSRSAAITLTDDAVDSPQAISLSGTGVAGSGSGVPSTGYTLTPDTSAVSITQGGTAVYNLSVAPLQNFKGSINFTCVGQKVSNCSVSPSTVTMDGTTTQAVKVSINTGGGSSAKLTPAEWGAKSTFLAVVPFSMMGMLLITKRRNLGLAIMLVVLALLMGMAGCGSSGSSSSSSSGPLAPGAYQVTVTAVSTGSAPVTENLVLNLQVNAQ